MTEPDVELPPNADELLRDFPLAEPDFEAQARAIEARLAAPAVASALSDEALFGVPDLAAEPNEPPLPSQVRAAPKSHFAEMARRSLQKPGEDEEAAALAKELLAATARTRRPNAELVERVRAAGKSAATATPLPLGEARPERSSGVVPRAISAASPAAAPAARDRRGVVIALVGVSLAAAAAFVLFLRPPADVPASATLPAAPAARSSAAAEPAPPEPVAAAPAADIVSPDALPQAAAAAAKSPDPVRAKPGSAVSAAAKPAAPPTSAPAAVALPEEEPTPLVAATPPARSPEEPALRPAEGNSGSVPLSPSSGAVSTALGAVRGNAQACLAGQTEPVVATITFASDGHVLRVSASGPSGACIQGALSKAHIAPFAKDSFSATTTIRPP